MSVSRSRSRGRSPQATRGSAPRPEPAVPRPGTTVWCGGLPRDINEHEVESQFIKFGKIIDTRLKKSDNGPPFAFVEYENPEDAADACRKLDQTDTFGRGPVKVQLSTHNKVQLSTTGQREKAGKGKDYGGKGYGKGRYDSRGRGGRYWDGGKGKGYGGGYGGGRYDSRGRGGGYGGAPPPRTFSSVESGKYKIKLEGLPSDMTWTELKELGKQYVENQRGVTFSRTFRLADGQWAGILEFKEKSDAEGVMRKLDGRKIKGHDGRLKVYHTEDGR